MKYSIFLKKVKVDFFFFLFVEKIIKMCLIKIMVFVINRVLSLNIILKLFFMVI